MVRAQNRLLLLFLTPALIMIAVFTILPALWAVYVSFTRMALAGPNALDMSFIGLRNYQKLLREMQRDKMTALDRQRQLAMWKARGRVAAERMKAKRGSPG